MDKEIREKIALRRYQIISPVLAEPSRAQNDYFRNQANFKHEFPHYGVKKSCRLHHEIMVANLSGRRVFGS